MERKEQRKHSPYLVCWDNNKGVGWKSRDELFEIVRNQQVDWIQDQGNESLNQFELEVFKAYIKLSNPEEGIIPGNKEMAEFLSTDDNLISRNALARARRRVARKLHFEEGW